MPEVQATLPVCMTSALPVCATCVSASLVDHSSHFLSSTPINPSLPPPPLLQSQQQYESEGGITRSKEPRKFAFTSVTDIIRAGLLGNQGLEGAVLQMDQLQFVSLLQTMLTFDPAQRLSPAHALQHHYITMQHLSTHTNTLR